MSSQNITILCNTFPPERGAAAVRLWQMAKVLVNAGYKVNVITVLPNYPTGKIFEGYRNALFHEEEKEGMKIYRMRILPSNSPNTLKRALSMGSHVLSLFTTGLWRMLMAKSHIIIINTPSVVNGFTGSMLSQLFTKAKVVLNVSDIYPHTALVLGAIQEGARYRWLQKMERRMYRRADAFLAQSEEILQHIYAIEGHGKPGMVYRNLKTPLTFITTKNEVPKRIVYAGLLGVAQGVARICEAINFKECNTELHIYGDGAERKTIEKFIAAHPDRGIHYHGSVPEEEVPTILSQYHGVLVPLVAAIKGAVPSKIFMAMAHQLPIVLMGSGEPADIVEQHGLGWVVSPSDYDGLSEAIKSFAAMSPEAYHQLQLNAGKAQREVFHKERQEEALLRFLKQL